MSTRSDADHHPPPLKVKVQIHCGEEIAMGPGKADLLDAIAEHGSISAAGRALGISYRRCWMLVDVMNRCWSSPVVEAAPGGSRGGGAQVTDFGRQLLRDYRALQMTARVAAGDEWTALSARLLPEPLPEQAR